MYYKNYLLILLAAILLAACTSAKEIMAPDGGVVYKINCDGLSLDWHHCYQKAEKICQGHGYNFVRRNHGNFDIKISTAEEAQNVSGYGDNISRYTFIRCK